MSWDAMSVDMLAMSNTLLMISSFSARGKRPVSALPRSPSPEATKKVFSGSLFRELKITNF